WSAGLYHQVPAEIDHAMVAMALDHTGGAPRLAMLMRDISASLIPEGDAAIPVETHDCFMDHMAAFHAAYWGWRDDVGLASIESRLTFSSDANIAREMDAADPPVPIKVAQEGWAALPERSPALWRAVGHVRKDPAYLAD